VTVSTYKYKKDH